MLMSGFEQLYQASPVPVQHAMVAAVRVVVAQAPLQRSLSPPRDRAS